MRTPADQPAERSAALDALFARIRVDHGGVITAELAAGQLQTLVDDLWRAYLSAYDDVKVRLVLGAACGTRAAAVRQFVAALQLPHDDAGRRELIEYLRQPFACLGGGFSTVVLVTILR